MTNCLRPRTICFFIFLFTVSLFSQTSYEKGVSLFSQQKFEKAKGYFQDFLIENPGHQKSIEFLGDIAGHQKNWDEAIKHYKYLAKEEPKKADFHYKYGGAMGMKAKSVNQIRALSYISDIKYELETASRLDKNHIEVRWALIELYLQLPQILGGSEKTALQYAQELQEISEVDGYLAKAHIAENKSNGKEAEKYYLKAIEVGGSPHSYSKLIQFYKKNNAPNKAIALAKKSAVLHKDNFRHYQIGEIAAENKVQPQLGMESLERFLINFSEEDGVSKEQAYFRMAQIYRNSGDKISALMYIEKALSTAPEMKEANQEKTKILSL